MDMIDTPQAVVQPGPIQPHSQPVAALANLDPVMDDAAVRQAIVNAEAAGIDPQTLQIADMAQGQAPQVVAPPVVAQPAIPGLPKMDIPEKFLRPDGVVDVEKLQASTRQLDEVIQKKEAAVAKTIDDYMREYRERETKFKNLPNPDRLAAQLPQPPAQIPQQNPDVSGMSTQQLEEMIRRDYQQDPIMTTTRLIDIAVQKALEPVRAREHDDVIRKNVESLATLDERVLHPQVYAAINAKLTQMPSLWNLPNPHRAAWLEVKEELRLGEAVRPQAQPSRLPSPVLGGGTPPSAPSSSGQYTPNTVIANLDRLDLKDRRQEALGDEAIKAILAGRRT